MSHSVTLLGPQHQRPSLAELVDAVEGEGPVCAVTAGWQEEEGEVDELTDCGDRIVDLRLYQRAEMVFEADPALFQAHRQRQTQLQELQRLYRLRLGYALAALEELYEQSGDKTLLATQKRAALAAVRTLDRQHGRLIRQIHNRFLRHSSSARHPLLTAQRAELAGLIENSRAVLLAGGHVAILVARLRLFELGPLLAAKPLIAWSAGAMALAEQIVAYHDHPPQGPNEPELLDTGLGLLKQILPLPHARQRLRLDDRDRMAIFATRFRPARCLTLDKGALLRWEAGRLREARNVYKLNRDGRLTPLEVGHAR